MLTTVKGEDDTRKEVDVSETVKQQAKMTNKTDPEPPKASPANTLPLEKEMDIQENFEIFRYLAEAMAKCLLDDPEMRSLLSAAMTKIANERPKNNLALLLKQSAEKLKKDFDLEAVAHFVSMTASKDQNITKSR